MTQKKINKYYHTLTGWENKNKMIDYLRGKHHAMAMKNFRSIGTGVHGYEDDLIWEENRKMETKF